MSAVTNNETQDERIQDLLAKCQDLSGEIERVVLKVDVARNKNRLLEKENKDLRDDAELTARQMLEKMEEASQLMAEKKRLTEEVEELMEKLADQEKQSQETKTYADLLEKMIDDASVASSSTEQSSAEEQEEMESLKKENKELHDMMEEFGRMWTQDTKQFRENVEEVNTEKALLEKEVEELSNIRLQDQKKIRDLEQALLQKGSLETELDQAEAQMRVLNSELESVRRERQEYEEKIVQVLQMKDAANAQFVERHHWLNQQATELKTALDELYESREKTAEQLETLSAKWDGERLAYEARIASMDNDQKIATNNHNKAQIEWTMQMEALNSQIDEVSKTHTDFRKQLEVALQQATRERAYFQVEATRMTDENVRLMEELDLVTASKRAEEDALNKIVTDMENGIAIVSAKLQKAEDCLRENSTEMSQLNSDLSEANMQIDSLQDQIDEIEEHRNSLHEEVDNLDKKLRVALRDHIADKEKTEKQHEKRVSEIHRSLTAHISEVNQSHSVTMNEMHKQLLALGQELAQCHVDLKMVKSEAEKNAATSDERRRHVHSLQCELGATKNNLTSLVNENLTLKKTIREVKEFKEIERVGFEHQIQMLNECAAREQQAHKKEVKELVDYYKQVVENMGIETYDDDEEDEMPVQKEQEEPEVVASQAAEAVDEEKKETDSWELVQ